MRQVGAMIGVSHVAISQFENKKIDLPGYRIEQLVKARGHSHESDFADCFHIELKRCVMNEVSVLTSLVFKILGLIIAVGCLGTIYESVKRQRENAAIAFRKDQISNSEWNRVLHRL